MAEICDRSPCDKFIAALGRFVFSKRNAGSKTAFVIDAMRRDGETQTHAELDIEYCPFCGTRLEEVGPGLLQKFLPQRPSRRQQNS